jgi:hypothetical protein
MNAKTYQCQTVFFYFTGKYFTEVLDFFLLEFEL